MDTKNKIGKPLKNKVGRPTDYTREKANEICNQLSEGISLRTVCLSNNMPDKATVFRWLRDYKEFHDQYAHAKEESTNAQHEVLEDLGDQAIKLAQSVDSKASGAVVQAVKLKADNLKWLMSKMKPKKYGEKLDMTTNGKDLPTPLLHALRNKNVCNNNSNGKNIEGSK